MSGPSYAHTRLTTDRYLSNWNTDLELFVSAARGNEHAPVPTCPEWTVSDLAHHLANVYQHKTWILALGKWPEDSQYLKERAQRANEDPLERVVRWAQVLQRDLLARPAEQPVATFMADDPSIEFWFRRMALETLVHRTDAEFARGELTTMNPELSTDGVDEMLWFWVDEHPAPDERWHGQRVALATPSTTWLVTLDRHSARVELAPAGSTPDATVRADPGDLLLWTAGRTIRPVDQSGDLEALNALHDSFTSF